MSERWEEVLHLRDKYVVSCVMFNEVGTFDQQVMRPAVTNYRFFYQKGENSWGGVLMLIKASIPSSRIKCQVSNVCVVEIKLERTIQLIGIYVPKSKSWE